MFKKKLSLTFHVSWKKFIKLVTSIFVGFFVNFIKTILTILTIITIWTIWTNWTIWTIWAIFLISTIIIILAIFNLINFPWLNSYFFGLVFWFWSSFWSISCLCFGFNLQSFLLSMSWYAASSQLSVFLQVLGIRPRHVRFRSWLSELTTKDSLSKCTE